jgi:fibronectin type 3 domain-containing protein
LSQEITVNLQVLYISDPDLNYLQLSDGSGVSMATEQGQVPPGATARSLPNVWNCLVILAWSVLSPAIIRAQAPPVPPEFLDLYTSLNTYLTTFNASINYGKGSQYPVAFALDLKSANGNVGPQLANSGSLTAMQLQLQELQAMGAKAIAIEIGFPLLYERFLTGQGQNYTQFVSLYQQVAAAVRAAGMQLIVENDSLLSNDVQAGWNVGPFYATLDWAQYQQARAQTALTVAQTLQPDYLVVLEEPDTEAANTGQSQVNTPSGAAGLVSQMLSSVQQAGLPNMKVGAGVGTWLNGGLTFIQDFTALPLDFIDMHVYSVDESFLPNALQFAATAGAAGKPVAMTECWLSKVRDSELGILTPDEVRARDPFSFWAPLDAYFLQTMLNLGNYTQMLFLAPMGTEYFAAYLPYDPSTQNLTPSEIMAQESTQASQNINAAIYTSTATSYHNRVVSPPDQTPPTVAGGLAGGSANPNTTFVNWALSTDNVGVAGYNVLRNGVAVGTTANAYFEDSGLAEATTYSYSVVAFDLAGNTAAPSLPLNLTTKDVTPPTTPGNLTATAPSSQKVSLSWSPSTDKVGLRLYQVFWGISPNALVQAGNTQPTVTAYTSYPLTAGTTYYYGVTAVDTSGNISNMSPIVSVTTPLLPPPPASVSAAAVSATKVALTWTASAGSTLPISYYQVLRGSSTTNMSQVGATALLTYTDRSATANTTYYYAIQAVDTGNDVSGLSPVASATTPGLPSAPTNLSGTAGSATKITLTWLAAVSGGLPIQYYQVFRGSSPANLSVLGNTGLTSYTDRSLTADTLYYYAVTAVDTGGDVSALSATVHISTASLPSAPTNLAATAVSTTKISLTWSAAVSGGLPIQNYHVFRGNSPSSLSQIVATPYTVFTDATGVPDTTYYYAVQASDTGGDLSPMSAVVAATTLALPSAPTNVAAVAISKSEIDVTWTAALSGMPLQSYTIYRGSSAKSLALLKVVGATKLLYADHALTSATTYYYGIEATDTQGNVSPMSSVVDATTQ